MGDALDDPEPVLHNKPVSLANMRTHGRKHVFVNCGNPDCYHNAELDVSRFPDEVTFNNLQPRMLCTVCDHPRRRRWAVMAASWLIGRTFDQPIVPQKGKALTTLKDAATYIMALPKAKQQSPEWQAAAEALLMAAEDRGALMHAHIGMMLA